MSYPTKPPSLKAITGSREPNPEPEIQLEPLKELPAHPAWLTNLYGIREWERLGPILVANGLLTDGSVVAFGTMCALHGALVTRFAEDELPPANFIGHYRALVNDFGLTPASQGKVRLSGDGKKQNKFTGNRIRAA